MPDSLEKMLRFMSRKIRRFIIGQQGGPCSAQLTTLHTTLTLVLCSQLLGRSLPRKPSLKPPTNSNTLPRLSKCMKASDGLYCPPSPRICGLILLHLLTVLTVKRSLMSSKVLDPVALYYNAIGDNVALVIIDAFHFTYPSPPSLIQPVEVPLTLYPFVYLGLMLLFPLWPVHLGLWWLPEFPCIPHSLIFLQIVKCAVIRIKIPLKSVRVAVAITACVYLPDRATREELPSMRLQPTNGQRIMEHGLAPAQALNHETIQSVAESATILIIPWNNPAVDSAALVVQFVHVVGAELKYEEVFAVETEYLGTLVFHRVSKSSRIELTGNH